MSPHSALADERFAAASVYTSGQQPPEIVELSLVTIDSGAVSSRALTWRARPVRDVTRHAVAGYGISLADLVGRPPFAVLSAEVAAILDGRRLVAHGAIVVTEALRAELPALAKAGAAEPVDTLPLVARVWPRVARRSLPELTDRARLRIPGNPAGTPWRAEATARLFLHLVDLLAERLTDAAQHLTTDRLCRVAAPHHPR